MLKSLKILVLALILIIMAFVLAGCDNKDKQEIVIEETDKDVYDSLLQGDFSYFAGTYINSIGKTVILEIDGTVDAFNKYKVIYNPTPRKYDDGTYGWLLDFNEIQPSNIIIYPVGVVAYVDDEEQLYDAYSEAKTMIETDISKIRLRYGVIGFGGSETDFYYKQ